MSTRWGRGALLLVALGSVALGAARSLGSDYPGLAVSLPDDAYYYLLPAWNMSRHGFFTFDGLHPTFGFQPLWGVVLAGLGALCRDRETFLRAAILTSEVLHAATAVALGLAGSRLAGPRTPRGPSGRLPAAVAAGLFLSNVCFLRASTNGMENALYGLLIAVNAAGVLGPARGGPAAWTQGALIGLLPFARLTPGSLAVTGAFALFAARRDAARCTPLVAGLLGTLAVGLCSERLWLGHWFPTSGAIKLLGFAEGLRALDLVGWTHLARSVVGYPANQVLFGLGLPSGFGYADNALYCAPLLAIALLLALRRRAVCVRTWVPLAVLAAALVASMATPVLLNRRGIELYYYVWYAVEAPVLLPLVVAGAVCGGRGATQRAGVAWVAAGLAGLVAAAVVARSESPLTGLDTGNAAWGTWQRAIWEGAQRANVLVPVGERIGAFNAGLLGYASDRVVINLDGLANDDILRTPSLHDYVRSERIGWIVDAMPNEGWFGQDRTQFDIVEAIPFSFPGFQGYFVARVKPTDPGAAPPGAAR